MKIRDKMMLSFGLLIAMFLILFVFSLSDLVEDIVDSHEKVSEDTAGFIIERNLNQSEAILTRYAEKMVEQKAEDVASELSAILDGRKQFNYEEMRKDEQLREIAVQEIYSFSGEFAGYTDLFDNRGNSVIHPNNTVQGMNYSTWNVKYPEMWKLVQQSFHTRKVKGYYRFIDEDNQTREKFMVLVQVPNSPFIVSSAVNIDLFFQPLQSNVRRSMLETVQQVRGSIEGLGAEMLQRIRTVAILGTVLLLVIGTLMAYLLAESLARPIKALSEGVGNLGKGNFSTHVPPGGTVEIVELTGSFNRLGEELTKYTDRLQAEVAARQTIENELKFARNIQETLQPLSFPDTDKFEIFASLKPAREVSGDFFDIFFMGEDTLVFIVGDVSGKGIPAAIFMAMTMTALKNNCLTNPDNPAKALQETNYFLGQYEQAGMFITLFLAYYKYETGRVIYANAGHHEAISVKHNGQFELFGAFDELALGIFPETNYSQGEYTLEKGDGIALYTDGIIEALSSEGEDYGVNRLCVLLSENIEKPTNEICNMTIESVTKFRVEKRSDDATILALKRKP